MSQEKKLQSQAVARSNVAQIYNDSDQDDDEEEDFDPDEEENYSTSSEMKDYFQQCELYHGQIVLDNEGYILCYGEWGISSQSEEASDEEETSDGHYEHAWKKTRITGRFQLKSQNVYSPSSVVQRQEINECDSKKASPTVIRAQNIDDSTIDHGDGTTCTPHKPIFDLCHPTLSHLPTTNVPSFLPRRTILFDGYFSTDIEPCKVRDAAIESIDNNRDATMTRPMTIHEQDVELIFSISPYSIHKNNIQHCATTTRVEISGGGYNHTFGRFEYCGKYYPPKGEKIKQKKGKKNDSEMAKIFFHKLYHSNGASPHRRTKRKMTESKYDNEEEEEETVDSGDVYSELVELSEDAHLSVEQLRKKYCSDIGGDRTKGMDDNDDNDDDDGGGKMPAKKSKVDESEDDDECGF